MKIDSSRQTCPGQTDGRTDIVTPWAPCRSQKFRLKRIKQFYNFETSLEIASLSLFRSQKTQYIHYIIFIPLLMSFDQWTDWMPVPEGDCRCWLRLDCDRRCSDVILATPLLTVKKIEIGLGVDGICRLSLQHISGQSIYDELWW